jgi:diguanylate cyclase (GGDEF)-like protein/PAS domain S-box-containing protein
MARSVDARVEKILQTFGALVWDVDLDSGQSTWWVGGRDEPESGEEPVVGDTPALGDGALPISGATSDARGAGGAAQADRTAMGSTRRLAPLGPTDRERVVAAALAALEGRDRIEVTRRVELSDGTARWFDMSMEISAGPDGAGARVLGTALDVTCTEEALDRLRLHSQHSEELVVRVRVGARLAFEYVSPASLFFTGYSPRELYDNGIAYALNAVEPATLAAIQHDGMLGSLDGKTYEFPTRRKDGSVLWVRASLREHVDESGDLLLEITVRDIGQTRALELEVSKLRLTDTLTGVSSRQALEESWPQLREQARAAGTWTVISHVDVDRFGLVNSGLGIAAGDELLRAVARRLIETVGDGDLVVRLGSDDFVVVVTGAASRVAALGVAAQLAGAFREPVRSSGHGTFVSVSVGASVIPAAPWSRADGLDVRLAEAEVAMRVVKQRGGNGIEVFADEMRTEARDKVELLAALRDGIETGAFVLHYQPLVDMRTMGVVGAEALVRWTHPTRGLLSPAEFVGMAEETGWIVPIGAWVVEHACAAATQWPQVLGQKVKVAVNLSARQLNSVDLVGAVGAALSRCGLDPGDLILEITETAFIHDFEAAIWTLRRMGDLGVHLALDDFGTGYSSLAYLVQLPIDRVKIDRSMVAGLRTNPHSRAVVAGIVGMAEALGIEVIAEGVERPDQVEALRSLGCSLAQGYYFARPLPLRDIVALLDGEVPWEIPFQAS